MTEEIRLPSTVISEALLHSREKAQVKKRSQQIWWRAWFYTQESVFLSNICHCWTPRSHSTKLPIIRPSTHSQWQNSRLELLLPGRNSSWGPNQTDQLQASPPTPVAQAQVLSPSSWKGWPVPGKVLGRCLIQRCLMLVVQEKFTGREKVEQWSEESTLYLSTIPAEDYIPPSWSLKLQR